MCPSVWNLCATPSKRPLPKQKAAVATTDPTAAALDEAPSRRLLEGMSIFTTLMTVPQIWTMWVGHQIQAIAISTCRASDRLCVAVGAGLWTAYIVHDDFAGSNELRVGSTRATRRAVDYTAASRVVLLIPPRLAWRQLPRR